MVGLFVLACLAPHVLAGENYDKDDADRSKPAGPLHLTSLDADLQLETIFDWRKVDAPRTDFFTRSRGSDRQINRQFRLEETLGLHLGGDLIFPELLNYDINLRLGLDHLWSKENSFFRDQADRDTGYLIEYDVNLSFLSRRPIHFDVYATQQDERISRRFLPALDHEFRRYGATLWWENEKWPMELTVERRRDRYTGTSEFDDDEDFEDTLIRYAGTLKFTPHHQLQIDAQHSRIEQQYSGGLTRFTTSRTVLNLDDRIEFGSHYEHLFETIFEYEEDQGDLPRDHLYLGPQLTLQHSDALSTRYKYQFRRERFDDLLLRSHRFDIELTHQLWDSLTTTADVYAGHETSEDGITGHDYGGLIRWTYRKKNRLGIFSGTLGYSYDQARTSYDARVGTAVDEVVFFQDPLPSFLAHQNVTSASVVVTDLNRTRIFERGRDYTVAVRGTRAALVRIRSGRIADEQSVRVHYRYRTAQKTTLRTHQLDARIQQDFNSGWTPYYALTIREQQTNSKGTIFIEPNNIDRHRFGLSYRRDRWSAGAEIEFNDEAVDPYDATHFNFDWAILTAYPDRLDLHAGISQFWFRDAETRRSNLFDISLDYRRPIGARIDLSARTAYRYEHDTITGATQGIDLAAGIEYRIGKLTLGCELEYDRLDLADSRDDGLSLWIRLKRDFPDLLRY